MRILVIAACPLPWPRGTPIRIHRMAEALWERGHDLQVLTYPLGSEGVQVPYPTHRVGAAMRMSPNPGPSLTKLGLLDPLLTLKTRALLRTERFDVIHAHHYEALIAALLARRGSKRRPPIVYDAHTLLASELPYYRLPIPRKSSAWIGLRIDRALPRRADHLIAVTQRMHDWFTDNATIAPARVTLIPNGVEHQHFHADAAAPSGGESGAASEDQPRAHVVFTGNLARYQGIDLLLLAFRDVHSRLPHARLTLVTDSDGRDSLAQARALGLGDRVRTVQVDYAKLPAQLAKADVLVNPRPDCDGIPQKLLNYMAAGKPIVSFAGSAPLLAHEHTALLVAGRDTAAFAEAIVRIIQTPRLGERLGAAARAQVVATHGWQQVAARVEAVYAHVAAESHRLLHD